MQIKQERSTKILWLSTTSSDWLLKIIHGFFLFYLFINIIFILELMTLSLQNIFNTLISSCGSSKEQKHEREICFKTTTQTLAQATLLIIFLLWPTYPYTMTHKELRGIAFPIGSPGGNKGNWVGTNSTVLVSLVWWGDRSLPTSLVNQRDS